MTDNIARCISRCRGTLLLGLAMWLLLAAAAEAATTSPLGLRRNRLAKVGTCGEIAKRKLSRAANESSPMVKMEERSGRSEALGILTRRSLIGAAAALPTPVAVIAARSSTIEQHSRMRFALANLLANEGMGYGR